MERQDAIVPSSSERQLSIGRYMDVLVGQNTGCVGL